MSSKTITTAAAWVLAAPVLGACLVAPAFAQIPPGSALVGTFHNAALKATGDPGLYIVSIPDGKVTAITGLPFQFTYKSAQFPSGAWMTTIRPSDGAVAATVLFPGDVNLWLFQLKGSAVDATRSLTVPLGKTEATSLGITNVALLRDGRFFVTSVQQDPTGKVSPLSSGPMKGNPYAIVDTSTAVPTVTPLGPQSGDFGEPSALSYRASPDGNFIYRLSSTALEAAPGTKSALARLDLKTLKWCRLASWVDEHSPGMEVDDDGTVYVSSWRLTTTEFKYRIHKVVPQDCGKATVTTQAVPKIIAAWAVTLDRRSGRLVVGSVTCPSSLCDKTFDNSLAFVDPSTGQLTKITNGPAGGWQAVAVDGVTMQNVMGSYGKRTDAANAYYFDNFPNAGGQPVVGNSKFSLTVNSTPGAPVASVLLLSNKRDDFDFMGLAIHIDPRTMITLPLGTTRSSSLPLPIPNETSLRGLALFAQSFHKDSTGYATSHGLGFTVQ